MWNQNNSEHEWMCGWKRKVKVTLHAVFNEHSFKLLESWVTKRWKGEFEVYLNGVETSCFVKRDIFHSKVRSNMSTWTIDQTALNIQFHNHVGIQIRCGMGKNVENACIFYRSKVTANIFFQINFWFWVDQSPIYFSLKRPLVLKFCSYGGKWLLNRFQGQNRCYRFRAVFWLWEFLGHQCFRGTRTCSTLDFRSFEENRL